jgi:hypothetical protein
LSSAHLSHPWHYLVVVSRRHRFQQFVYARLLRKPLPKVAIPLSKGDSDVTLDLQAAFTRCWEEGPYPELLRYQEPPPGTLSPDDRAWCAQLTSPWREAEESM